VNVDETFVVVAFLIGVALIFDYINGFHDAANSIATVVATRVLSPGQAVVWAAFFNFVAAFGFGLHVANTIGKGTIKPEVVDNYVILAALTGAIVWDLITWYWGIPSSSSHALIGGLVGAGLAKAGPEVIVFSGLQKTALFIVLSPTIGFILGVTYITLVAWLTKGVRPQVAALLFRRLQLVSAAAYSLGHGTNDAQKTMGIIAALLYSAGYLGPEFYVPTWVVLAAHAAIALGTFAGGWRIIHTMATRITHLQPVGGFAAETAAATNSLHGVGVGHSGEHDAYDHRGHRGRGLGAAALGGALGRGRPHRVGLGADHPGGRRRGGRHLLVGSRRRRRLACAHLSPVRAGEGTCGSGVCWRTGQAAMRGVWCGRRVCTLRSCGISAGMPRRGCQESEVER